MQHHKPKPPRWFDIVLKKFCHPDVYEEIQGDLHEIFNRAVEKMGEGPARRQYVWNVLRSLRSSAFHPGSRTMDQRIIRMVVGMLVVPVGAFLLLVSYSMLLSWNLGTMILFWCYLLPVTAYYLPIKVTGRQDRFIKTTGGLLLFYGFMVFMTYSHYQSDYFVLMIICALVNLTGVGLVAFFRTGKIRQWQ